ncbi:MmgE/PrpD family protein [Chloroflexota bacterium]
MNESRGLAGFVAGLKYDDLPEEVVQKTKDLILDQLGVELTCSTKPWSKAVYQDTMNAGGKEESTIVNYGDKVPVLGAAFVNGSFGHGFELDDMYRPGLSHPGCVIVPAALALGEREVISGKKLILAVAVGYEIMGRVGAAASPSLLATGHHPTSTSGPFGAAAAGASILGFDEDMTLHALGIAGSMACGLTEFNQTGGLSKRMHGGLAASGGLRGVLLARGGITAPPTILEGRNGFLRAYSNEKKTHMLTDNLGKSWVVLDIGYKLYANCGMNHAPLDSLLKIIKNHPLKAEDIAEIVILHNSQAQQIIGVIKEPATVTDAQFSGYFNLAMAVVLGNNNFRNYTEETLKDRSIRELAKKVRFEVDPEAEANFPQKRIAGVAVKLKDGTTYREKTEYAKGMPENPFTTEELRDKFRDLSSMVLQQQQVEKAIETLDSLEKLGNIHMLVRTLRN